MDEDIIQENLKDVRIKFKTRPGVFSKKGLDAGSRLLLENINIPDRSLVADLGCGSGVIGLIASKINRKAHVHLFDVNLRFIELAKENAELNRLKNVEIFLSDQFSAVPDRTYNMILSNPAQHLGNQFLEETATECLNHLKINGEVYWVLQAHIKPFAERLFKQVFGNYDIVATNRDYVIIKAVKNA